MHYEQRRGNYRLTPGITQQLDTHIQDMYTQKENK